ncbi:MAG TPA: DUF6787 family protein [Candidatus Krumholzibacteria bacterium]|nr:DUF6787 family protein [Candidatus Krumholzibacteria bacterium]
MTENSRVATSERVTFWERLQARWGVSARDAVFILIAFALAGMTVLKIGSFVVNAIVPAEAPKWLWWTVKVLVVVPIYEVLLLTYGILLGQRRFFVDKQRRLLRLLAKPFRRR